MASRYKCASTLKIRDLRSGQNLPVPVYDLTSFPYHRETPLTEKEIPLRHLFPAHAGLQSYNQFSVVSLGDSGSLLGLQYKNYTVVVMSFIVSCTPSGAMLALDPCLATAIYVFFNLGGAAP
jgi:hypothetical protein